MSRTWEDDFCYAALLAKYGSQAAVYDAFLDQFTDAERTRARYYLNTRQLFQYALERAVGEQRVKELRQKVWSST